MNPLLFGIRVCSVLLVLSLMTGVTTAFGVGIDYFVYNDYGGSWSDAEKNNVNTEDDLMCWAAASSNVLDWTGWGYPASESFTS